MRVQRRHRKRGKTWMVLAAAACCALGAAALVLLLPTVTAQRLIQDGGNPTLTAVSSRQALNAPYLSQEDYPTGCESVAAVMALQYWGVDLTVEEFIDGYLPLGDAPHTDSAGHFVGCDPRKAFPGDPREETGWGCYSPVIEKALVQVLSDQQRHDLAVARVDGASLEELYDKYVSQGTPVLLWVTIGMETPGSAPCSPWRTAGRPSPGSTPCTACCGWAWRERTFWSTTPWRVRRPATPPRKSLPPTTAWAAKPWWWPPPAGISRCQRGQV